MQEWRQRGAGRDVLVGGGDGQGDHIRKMVGGR